jgi:hypothetical protein
MYILTVHGGASEEAEVRGWWFKAGQAKLALDPI